MATLRGAEPPLSEREAIRLRDMLAHRGPDSAGLWRWRNYLLAHRRLAVIDPSPAGAQPMFWGEHDGGPRYALIYNGALYNDDEIRRGLKAQGVSLRTSCDTETILAAFAAWGEHALSQFRGMYALALVDTREHTLTLARDPLGIKPLCFTQIAGWVAFASEPPPLLNLPGVSPEPDLAMVAGYLSTIRTVLGERTLFRGIRAVEPGQIVRFDLSESGGAIQAKSVRSTPVPAIEAPADARHAAELVRTALGESVRLHLRADVPVCALLSGGLDSTAVTHFARRSNARLRTFCAGCPDEEGAQRSDLACARRIAEQFRTEHREAHITGEVFESRWAGMVEELGVPLSTPNEVAILEVARSLRSTGCIVTLSGEGADELFAGYEAPLDLAAELHGRLESGGIPISMREGGRVALAASGWLDARALSRAMRPEVWRGLEANSYVETLYSEQFERAWAETDGDFMAAHQRILRRINLTGLLQRLDTATMLASVEGRTPIADVKVAALAEALPMSMKFRRRRARVSSEAATSYTGGGRGATAVASRPAAARTKIVLRRALRRDVPGWVLRRPKASFPLPFQQWIGARGNMLRRSGFIKGLFADAAIEAATSPAPGSWRLAWPMINLAMWAERWNF